MNPRSTTFEKNTLTITPPIGRSWVHRWRVSVLFSKAVYRGFIVGVMVSVLVSKAVDRGFIGGVMVSEAR
jgi:hypothetical protein